jgi:hypothetical protein
VVVLVGGRQHEVLSFNPQFPGFFHTYSIVGGGIQNRGSPPKGRGGPGRGRGRGHGGTRGGAEAIPEPHRHLGIFIAKTKESMLLTKNLVPGESFYGEKELLSRETRETPRSNTGYGILPVASLLLVFSVDWAKSLSPLVRKCCTLVLQVVRASATLPTSSDQCVSPAYSSYV